MVAAGIQEGSRRTRGQKAFNAENGRYQQKTKIRCRQQQKRKTIGARDTQFRQQTTVQRPARAAAAQKRKNRIRRLRQRSVGAEAAANHIARRHTDRDQRRQRKVRYGRFPAHTQSVMSHIHHH